jgi:hypothetical protein
VRPLLLLLLLTVPALADQPPHLLPARDVTVLYRLAGDAAQSLPTGPAPDLRVSWNAGLQLLRVEPEGRTQMLLVNLGAGTVELLDRGLRTAMALPVRPGELQPLRLQGARFTRGGRATVAGLGCTEWNVQSSRGQGAICFTDDGVPLQAEGEANGRAGSFIATAVAYGPQDPQAFRVPPGYAKLALPRLGRLPIR